MNEQSTPLMRQYAAVKKEHPNALVFFRLGDFYEMFFEDAIVGARELQITLTSRNKEKGQKIPMCGIPYHAAEGYIAKLIRKGFKVALCEQMEDPKQTKTLVRREVTRVITPGTAAEMAAPAEESNFLAAVTESGGAVGFAALELSTGEFRATEFRGEDAARRVMEEMQQLRPKEVLFASSMPLFAAAGSASLLNPRAVAGEMNAVEWERPAWAETPLDDWIFAQDHAVPLLENHFGVLSLEGFGLACRPAAAAAAGAILHYVRNTQRGTLHHVDRIGFFERQDCLVLDAVTVRNLELVEPLFSGEDGGITLFRSLDTTSTPMGKRLLRAWMLRPALDAGEIQSRLDAVEAWTRDTVAREDLRRPLQEVLDLERLLSRVTLETANPRDLLSMAASLSQLPIVRVALANLAAQRIQSLHTAIDELSDLRTRIEQTLAKDCGRRTVNGHFVAVCRMERHSAARGSLQRMW